MIDIIAIRGASILYISFVIPYAVVSRRRLTAHLERSLTMVIYA